MHHSPGRRRIAATGILAALAVALGLLAQTPLASAVSIGAKHPAAAPIGPASQERTGGKPTVVLVHGAWADASSWNGVIIRLRRDGYTALAPANPLRSLHGDAAYISAFLDTIPGPIILVGHSYGGAVITNAATGHSKVKALVYVDAFAPAQGETVLSLLGPNSALATDPATVFDLRPYPGGPPGDVDVYLKPQVVRNFFAQDLPRRTQALIAATQRPSALSSGLEPSGVPAYLTTPSWYLIGLQDKVIPPERQLSMAQRAHAHITEINASHVSMISHPEAVERLVIAAARSTA
jgi:pimeloyl-ACP methyl ester carboxylesterase